MPNHCRNKLSVFGDKEQVEEFARLSKLPRPRTGDKADSLNYQKEEPQPQLFGFHGVVPLPKEYSEVPYSGDFSKGDPLAPRNDGYTMEADTWGVKWGPYNLKEENIVELDGFFGVEFTTAWGPPTRYLAQAAERFPELKFFLSYGGEGPTRGYMQFEGGIEVCGYDDAYNSDDYPEYDEDRESEEGYEDAYFEEYSNVEKFYIFTHDEWVRNPEMRKN